MDTRKILQERINVIKKQLDDLIAVLGDEMPAVPDGTVEKVLAAICLDCGERITKKEQGSKRTKLFCHERCYRRQSRAIDAGKTTALELTEGGKRLTLEQFRLLHPEFLTASKEKDAARKIDYEPK